MDIAGEGVWIVGGDPSRVDLSRKINYEPWKSFGKVKDSQDVNEVKREG
jgi:hypothetical protein